MTPERFTELKAKKKLSDVELNELFNVAQQIMHIETVQTKIMAECAMYRDTLTVIRESARFNVLDKNGVTVMCSTALDTANVGAEWIKTLQRLNAENVLMRELLGSMIEHCKSDEYFKEQYIN